MSYGLILALTAALCWGGSPLMQKYALREMTFWELNVARSVGVLLATVPFLCAGTLTLRTDSETYLLLALMAFINNVAGDTLLFVSIRHIGVSLASPITSAYPLMVALISWLYFKEALSPPVILGTGAVVAGLVLLNVKDKATTQARHIGGVMAALGAAACWAAGLALNKQLVAEGLSPLEITFGRGLFFFVMSLLCLGAVNGRVKARWRHVRSLSFPFWLMGGAAGILALVLGSIAYSASLKLLPITVATPIAASSPLISVIGARYYFGEKLSPLQWGGVTLILAGALAVTW